MNAWNIVKKVGAGAITALVPGGGAIVAAINAFLPADNQLPDNATGHDAASAIQSLPPESRAKIMARKFDIEEAEIKESHATVRAMLESDATMPHTTRPYIARGSFHVIAFTILSVVSLWSISVFNNDDSTIKVITDGWPFILAVLTPLVTLLHAYFGVLKHEHKAKLNAANGITAPSGIAGMLSGLMRK